MKFSAAENKEKEKQTKKKQENFSSMLNVLFLLLLVFAVFSIPNDHKVLLWHLKHYESKVNCFESK